MEKWAKWGLKRVRWQSNWQERGPSEKESRKAALPVQLVSNMTDGTQATTSTLLLVPSPVPTTHTAGIC